MVGGKRYLVLTGLVVALGLAVYVNWKYAPAEGLMTSLDSSNTASVQESENIGEAQLVNTGAAESEVMTASKDVSASNEYFAQAKLSRQNGRDEANDAISAILNSDKLTDDDKKEAVQKSVELADSIDKETKIESLIKAKGFSECLAIVSSDQVTVVVKSEGLLANEVSMIKDIVVGQTKIPVGNIKIIETK